VIRYIVYLDRGGADHITATGWRIQEGVLIFDDASFSSTGWGEMDVRVAPRADICYSLYAVSRWFATEET
jgi:hypothetical protein